MNVLFKRITVILCTSLMVLGLFDVPGFSVPVKAAENESWDFSYKGSVEEWTAPYSGKYKLEVWGAQGGSSATTGANGGYTMVEVPLLAGEKLYIACGGKGITNGKGGWNGGGDASSGGSGGGATSITTVNRGELKNFSDHKTEILAVSGGGGGSYSAPLQNQLLYYLDHLGNHVYEEYGDAYLYPGFGGGLYGQEAFEHMFYINTGSVMDGTLLHCDALRPIPQGATQITGYTFGQGESGASGAGGGYYGGYAGKEYCKSSAGGSGYAIETEFKHDYGYNINSGDGKAKIFYEGAIQRTVQLNTNGCGTYNGKAETTLTFTMGEEVTLTDIDINEGYRFVSWVDYDMMKYPTSFVMGKENLVLKALFVAPLSITAENDGIGTISISMSEKDDFEKYYKILQSQDGTNWYEAYLAYDSANGGLPTRNRQYNVGGYTYKAPITGKYKIRLYGAKGGDAFSKVGNASGGYGAYTEGNIELKRGDLLYIHIGAAGANGPYNDGNGYASTGRGGYASDIRFGSNTIPARLMVAAGGGAATRYVRGGRNGTHGGALTSAGINSLGLCLNNKQSASVVTGATQTNGGAQTTYCTYGPVNGTFAGTLNYPGGYGQANINSTGGYGYYGGGGNDTMFTSQGGTGGSSYISGYPGCIPAIHSSGYKFTETKMTAGARNGNGYGWIDILSDLSIYEDHADNIPVIDTKVPNAPSDGKYYSFENSIILEWKENGDNGNKYFHKVESYNQENNQLLNTSNVIEDYYETGVSGFYYYIDGSASGTVTKSHTFIEDSQIEIPTSASKRYLHVAAVDGAGNISGTYIMEIPSVAKYVVNHYAQNEDGSYTLVKTEEKMGQIGSTVTPNVIPQTGRDNPPAQSVVIKADGSTVVNYYYDVTMFNVVGNISWNDHENLYGTRPDSIGVTIYCDGEYFDYVTVPATDTTNKYSFDQLQKYDLETGREFEYTVSQDVAYSQAALEHSEDKYTTIQNGFDFLNGIRNTERPVKPGSPDEPENPDDKGFHVEGEIYWDDNENSLGFRPSEVTITIYQKGEDGEWKEFDEYVITNTKNDNHYIFDWLPKYWYDENDVPTAYEYKVEESFSSWYVKDGEIKDFYVIHEDQPNDFDFTNELIPDGPIIPVSEHTNTIIVKTNTNEPVRIILKPLEVFVHNDYSVSYGDPTGNDIPVVSDKTGISVSDLTGTRYEIIFDSLEYTLEDIKLSLAENMELEKIGDKWYVTILNVPADAIGTLEIELSKKEQFYQDRQSFMNYFAAGLKVVTNELPEYFNIKMSDAILIPDMETDENTEQVDKVNNLTVTYMDSDTKDTDSYASGDEAEILDYLGKIPVGMVFTGWSENEGSVEAQYEAGNIIQIEGSIILYPVFMETAETTDTGTATDTETDIKADLEQDIET